MKQENKIQKGNVLKTALEITPLAVTLLDPEIASNPLSVVAKAGQAIAAHFLSKLSFEHKKRTSNDELKSSGFATEKPPLIYTDLLKIIGEGRIDAERFRAMKSIFFSSIKKDAGAEQEEIAYLLFQTAKQLSGAEILILSANYQIVKNTGKPLVGGCEWGSNRNVGYWSRAIAEKIGHNISELVLQHEKNLTDLRIITDRHYMKNNTEVPSEFQPSSYFRLTPLGYRLCEFITMYE